MRLTLTYGEKDDRVVMFDASDRVACLDTGEVRIHFVGSAAKFPCEEKDAPATEAVSSDDTQQVADLRDALTRIVEIAKWSCTCDKPLPQHPSCRFCYIRKLAEMYLESPCEARDGVPD